MMKVVKDILDAIRILQSLHYDITVILVVKQLVVVAFLDSSVIKRITTYRF